MSLRSALIDVLELDHEAFCDRAATLARRHEEPDTRRRLTQSTLETFDGPAVLSDTEYDRLAEPAQRLVWRLWLFDTAPVGLTFTGPAYQDTPLIYATRTFRELTGYSMAELSGANPRLLQGPETAAAQVDRLREAISIWEPATVELLNYRVDGSSFRNRVSLLPIEGTDGTVIHWIGIQSAVGSRSEL